MKAVTLDEALSVTWTDEAAHMLIGWMRSAVRTNPAVRKEMEAFTKAMQGEFRAMLQEKAEVGR